MFGEHCQRRVRTFMAYFSHHFITHIAKQCVQYLIWCHATYSETEVDGCALSNGGCSHQCIDTHDSYMCACTNGFMLATDQHTCQGRLDGIKRQVNCEVYWVSGACGGTSRCTMCWIHSIFYELIYNHINVIHWPVDIDECLVDNGGCSIACRNLIGSYVCGCPVGFLLLADGVNCRGMLRTSA